MKLNKYARATFMAITASMSVCMVQAKDINGLVLASPSVPVNTIASLQISFTSTDSALCGVVVDWGNGKQQNIRLGHDQHKNSPTTLSYAYPNPGMYNIKLVGQFMSRGLNSAIACNVLVKPITVQVTDPTAEKQAAEMQAAKIAAETALKQAAVREQEAAQRERAALAAAEKAKQDLMLQQAAAREMELNLKAKELERREAQMRKDEETRRAATARPAAPSAAAPAPAAPTGTRPPVKSADGF